MHVFKRMASVRINEPYVGEPCGFQKKIGVSHRVCVDLAQVVEHLVALYSYK